MVAPATFFSLRKQAGWLLALLGCLPLLGQAQTTLANYDFNSLTSSSAYPVAPATTAPGIISEATSSEMLTTYTTGTVTGPAAFVANATGPALGMSNSSGSTRYFQFSLTGAALPKYTAFKIYLQGYRSGTGATTLTLQYSVSGGAFQTFGSTYAPGNAVFTEGGFDLSGLPALGAPSSLTFRLVASGASASGSLRIDNFQVQATNTVDPFINTLSPSTVAAGGPDLPLTVTGSNFAAGAVVSFNGQNVATTYNSATSLTALVPAAAVAAPGTYPVVVASGGTSSAAVSFVVTSVVPRWTGGAGTSSWFDAPNWSTGTVPGTADDVLLDHSFQAAGYTVSFDQSTAVSIRSLVVNPGAGDSIFVVVPATNTAPTALTLSNTGATALAIYNKGVVTNASGAASGSFGIDAAGSNATVFIYNGGSYRHASSRSHAAVVENLSAVAGTEQGIFDFRLPTTGPASYALSVSNRTYGTLILRNRPNQSSTSYPAPGSTLTIQGDLVIGPSVTFTPTITNDLRVAGNVRVQGLLQLRNTAGSTTSQLVLMGNKAQTISGAITFDPGVGLVLNNAAGAVLATPLTLNGPLTLTSGNLTTTAANLLTLSSAATLAATSNTSFVNGPLARQTAAGAVSNLVFPTGSGASYRPVVLNATAQDATTYLVTQKEGLPANAASFVAGTSALPTLTRVSRVRSYTITPTPAANNFSGTVTLSFNTDDGVSQPTDPGFTVGKNSNGAGWQNIGNSGVSVTTAATTTSGAVGTITSQPFTAFSDFALASTSASQDANPLPVVLVNFGATRQAGQMVQVRWATASELRSAYFEVQRSLDGRLFTTSERQAAHGTTAQTHRYTSLDHAAPACRLYYRLRQVDTDGTESFSPVVTLAAAATLAIYPNPAHDELTLPVAGELVQVLDLTGRELQASTLPASGKLSIATLAPGTYLLRVVLSGQSRVLRFTKE